MGSGEGRALPQTSVADLIDRYANLIVRVGANVQPGQDVYLHALIEHAALARAIAEHAYRVGARRVALQWDDLPTQRSAIEHAPEEALGSVYPHELDAMLGHIARGSAFITLVGNPYPHLFEGLDPARVAKAVPRQVAEAYLEAASSGRIAWTMAAAPSQGWAAEVLGAPDVDGLWRAVSAAMRLDVADPVAAWQERMATLAARCTVLEALALNAIHFRGPQTDLTVGLIPGCRWLGGPSVTPEGLEYVANLPTEEVFTAPDWRSAHGTVLSTRPLALAGALVRGLRLRLENGRIVEVEADTGAEFVEAQLASDERAAFLGEVALVDGESPIARSGLVFHEQLYDENAGCHIAMGNAYTEALPGAERLDREQRLARGLNVAGVHTDVVIGATGVDVDGIGPGGNVTPIIRENRWVLPQ